MGNDSNGQPVESAEVIQATRDRRLGVRCRAAWGRIELEAGTYNLEPDQVRGFIASGAMAGDDAARKAAAAELGFDWESAAGFFAKIAPIVAEMIAACSAV
jgi:hypothetical protein